MHAALQFLTALSLAICAALPLAQAHFTLDYPLVRGFNENIEDRFCGGYPDARLPRVPWYYQNGPIQIDSHHDSAEVNIFISFAQNPANFSNFTETANGSPIPGLDTGLEIKGQGEFCFHSNVSKISVPGVNITAGLNATLLVQYTNNIHGTLYQCSDVTFSSDSALGSNITCTDSLTASASNTASSLAAPLLLAATLFAAMALL